ncbi:MAG: polysulfide reductase NrfD [Chloroflexi bacterium]|nr:polysulfide reductase NrfD [Chloroflexota bacterium]
MSTRRAPYGRRAVDVLGSVPPSESPPTYYERPALKPSDWRWLIITYFFVGGMAGAAQVIASIADLFGHERDRPLVSTGRYIALAGSLASPVLLIADLKTPSRWFNMLRVFRGTSPMSIGSWTLFAFGGFSALAAGCQLTADVAGVRWARTLARVCGVPAALSGALLATYTGVLLSATSTPLWATAYKLLPALFGASGTATATAMMSLVLSRSASPRASMHRLERLALVASAIELLLTLRVDRLWKDEHVAAPLDESPLVVPYRFGVLGLGILAPLGVHVLQLVTGRELRAVSTVASVAALVGGYIQRAVIIFAGEQSAERPRDYFGITQ